VTDRTTFERAKFWVDEVRRNEDNCKMYLTGTKVDLVENGIKLKQVGIDVASAYAAGNRMRANQHENHLLFTNVT